MQYLRDAYDLKEKLGKLDFDIITIALYLGECELKESPDQGGHRSFSSCKAVIS
jgi:hypothetical protein